MYKFWRNRFKIARISASQWITIIFRKASIPGDVGAKPLEICPMRRFTSAGYQFLTQKFNISGFPLYNGPKRAGRA
jgi:hypothetical protein